MRRLIDGINKIAKMGAIGKLHSMSRDPIKQKLEQLLAKKNVANVPPAKVEMEQLFVLGKPKKKEDEK